jgi:hypothetical protein
MAEDPDQMRARIDHQRSEITQTVDEIGNRVSPSHIVARRQDRMRRRLTDWRDLVFGNDEPDYSARGDDRHRFPEPKSPTQRCATGRARLHHMRRQRCSRPRRPYVVELEVIRSLPVPSPSVRDGWSEASSPRAAANAAPCSESSPISPRWQQRHEMRPAG